MDDDDTGVWTGRSDMAFAASNRLVITERADDRTFELCGRMWTIRLTATGNRAHLSAEDAAALQRIANDGP